MNSAATALIILLANQGHWFGGQVAVIDGHWAAEVDWSHCLLDWRLELGAAPLTTGTVAIGAGQHGFRLEIVPPPVHVRTTGTWSWELRRADNRAYLARGHEAVQLYPRDLLSGLAQRLAGQRIVVCDAPDGLPRVLECNGIAHTSVKDPANSCAAIQAQRADLILVGPNWLSPSPFSQAALLNQAAAGATVVMFIQTRVNVLAGYAVQRRAASDSLTWRTGHVLLSRLSEEDLRGLIQGAADLWAVQLPADEAALELGWWPREVAGREPAPIDALLVTKRVAKGRLVLCQVSLGGWEQDPRSLLILRNALEYSLVRPEPTPPPSQRIATTQPHAEKSTQITIPPGVKP